MTALLLHAALCGTLVVRRSVQVHAARSAYVIDARDPERLVVHLAHDLTDQECERFAPVLERDVRRLLQRRRRAGLAMVACDGERDVTAPRPALAVVG